MKNNYNELTVISVGNMFNKPTPKILEEIKNEINKLNAVSIGNFDIPINITKYTKKDTERFRLYDKGPYLERNITMLTELENTINTDEILLVVKNDIVVTIELSS